jgi:hypothetical protein
LPEWNGVSEVRRCWGDSDPAAGGSEGGGLSEADGEEAGSDKTKTMIVILFKRSK